MRRKVLLWVVIPVAILLAMGCTCNLSSLLDRKATEDAPTVESTVVEHAEVTLTPEPTSAIKATATATAARENTSTPTLTPVESEPTEETAMGQVSYHPLDTLDSYRYELTADTTQDGARTIIKASGEFVREPPAVHLDAEVTESEGAVQVIRFTQVDGAVYVFDQAQGGWIALPFDAVGAGGMSLFDELLVGLDDPLQAEAFEVVSLHEEASGVDCRHYHAAAEDLPADAWGGDMVATGGDVDAWVANELGYIAQMVMDVWGKDQDGAPASARVEVRLFDVNQPIQIDAPRKQDVVQEWTGDGVKDAIPVPDFPAGVAATLPRPEDARTLSESLPAQVRTLVQGQDVDFYETGLSVAEMTAFAEEAYPRAGWTKDDAMAMGEDMLLVFSREGEIATSIILGDEPGGSIVVVSVE